ncbi:hypothetical protein ACQ4M4_24605 [Leptolyngbya sp. AN02str]
MNNRWLFMAAIAGMVEQGTIQNRWVCFVGTVWRVLVDGPE